MSKDATTIPRVEQLIYALEVRQPERFQFVSPRRLEVDRDRYSALLEDGMLVVTMKADYATTEAALAVVEPFLREWEASAALEYGRRELKFDFRRSVVVGGRGIRGRSVTSRFKVGGGPTKSDKYPEPLPGFALTDTVEQMISHLELLTDRRETIGAAAYACLTLVEGSGPNRRARAATRLGIARPVLAALGRLSTEVGLPPRKSSVHSKNRPHTRAERLWIHAAMRLLIRRAGEVAHDPAAATRGLTMADLPPI